MSAVETIQRALELAADGKHRSIEDIENVGRLNGGRHPARFWCEKGGYHP